MTSKEIISFLVDKLSLKQDANEHNSFYGEYRIGENKLLVIRISNHRTYLSTWDERYKQTQQASNKIVRRMGRNLPDIFRKIIFYSFVFEDDIDTVGSTEVPSGRKINVNETVYKSAVLNLANLWNIKDGINQLSKTGYYNAEALSK